MTSAIHFVKRRWLEVALTLCVVNLGWMIYAAASQKEPGVVPSQRNRGFPDTYIGRIHLDLASPNHWVRLTWVGPEAAQQDAGPFRSSPGAGGGTNDCNDVVESNCPDSLCTPKGAHTVEGHMDHMQSGQQFRYVTMIDARRSISFHAHPNLTEYPASQGCVRLEPYAARLIHDNSIVRKTEVLIDGTWTNPSEARSGKRRASSSKVDE